MNALVLLLLAGGVFFLAISALGLLRLPDFYSRSHAAGKSETLGAILLLGGLALHHGFEHTSGKIVLILLLLAMGGPTGIHALTRAALRAGLEIWTRPREVRDA